MVVVAVLLVWIQRLTPYLAHRLLRFGSSVTFDPHPEAHRIGSMATEAAAIAWALAVRRVAASILDAAKETHEIVEMPFVEGVPQMSRHLAEKYELLIAEAIKQKFGQARKCPAMVQGFYILDRDAEHTMSNCTTPLGRKQWATNETNKLRVMISYVKRITSKSQTIACPSETIKRLK